MPFVIMLDQIGEDDGHRVGAKGLRLAQLARAGLPVPLGFCVTTAAFRAFLDASGLTGSGPRSDALTEAKVPPEVARVVRRAYWELVSESSRSSLSVAVRSSATAEDLPEASFAGQYDTFLNVGPDGDLASLLSAIRACWCALWGNRARTYVESRGLDLDGEIEMAVIVQQQVEAEAAGVLFTLNPLTGREEEMMLEAVWGLGEPLVSGRVEPDRYVVNHYDRQVLRREHTEQAVMLGAADGGGLHELPAPHGPVLDDAQLFELAELGYQVQALHGHPQDVEWALSSGRFFVLQARPLTAFQFDPELGQWTSANHREVLPGFASPLSISLSLEREYGRALAEMFRDLKMGEAPSGTVWGRPFFGRAYWNVGLVKRFAALIPGFKERTFDATVGIEPTYEGDGLTTPWTPRTVLRAVPVLFALSKRYESCWREAASFADRFRREEEPQIAAVDPASLSDDELARWVRRMVDLHERTNHVAITVSLLAAQAQDDLAPMLDDINRRLPPEEAIAFGDLITGLGEVGTAKPTLELWELARRAHQDSQIAEAVAGGRPGGIPERLEAVPAGRAFWGEVQTFLHCYRYMSRVDEDLAQPRWEEDPSFVLTTLQAYVRMLGDDRAHLRDPVEQLAAQREVARSAEVRAISALSQGWRRLWPFGRRSFRTQLERVRRYVWWREEMRVVASRAFYHCRRFFVELGHRWVSKDWLKEPRQIFLLRWDAIEAALQGRLGQEEIREVIDRYRRLRTAYRNFEPPGVIGRGVRPKDPVARRGGSLEGTACSGGQATGYARVVRNLEEARMLREGEILVAPYTNPGWTPIFNLAAGLIVETGGLLSHGAVVAREYGIPTVVGVGGATRLLRTGQIVTVDGSLGVVRVVEQGA
jgi:pyruvate,water dikinase